MDKGVSQNTRTAAIMLEQTDGNVDLLNNNLDPEVFHGDLNFERKRKSKAQPSLWKRAVNKKMRMNGHYYNGFENSAVCVNEKVTIKQTQTKLREAKYLGPRCSSKFCQRTSLRNCDKISEEARKLLFHQYWDTMDWKQRELYVRTLVDRVKKKKNTKGLQPSVRKDTCNYYLKTGKQRIQVCKFFFMSTFAISKKQLRQWTRNYVSGGDTEPVVAEVTKQQSVQQIGNQKYLEEFLAVLPKMPSHYCRKKTRKLYLEPMYTSVTQLFNVYKTSCDERQQIPVSRWKFDQVLQAMTISLFLPKKDQCDTCCGHEAGNVSDLDWNEHIRKKDRARDIKNEDKVIAKSGSIYALTMDLDSVKICPYLEASAIYFKRKLAVHNFTIYNLANHDTTCYWWNETEGSLEASSFASCVVDYLTANCVEDKPIVIFSDGCTHQNRNAIMSNALLNFAMNSKRTVIQKFLEKGHTQMECDSVHSAMETKLRNRAVYLPGDYASICMEARTKPNPYVVKYLAFDFFKDFSESTLTRYPSIRPGKKTGDPTVMDIRVLKHTPNGKIFYKLKFDDDWSELPRRPKQVHPDSFPPLHNERLKISQDKYNDLQDLKSVLPSRYHAFYDSLPH